MRPALEARIATHGAQDWITLSGRLSHEQLVAEYQRAWLVSSASLAEGWGLTLTEAAACGTPAVATDVSGHRSSVVDGVTGVLAPLDRLGEVMADVLLDDARRDQLAAAGLARAQTLTWDASARGILAALHGQAGLSPPRTSGGAVWCRASGRAARLAWRSCGGPTDRPRRCRRGCRGTSRSCRRASPRWTTSAASPSATRTCSMSNHSDFEYISQWYGANGARCAAAAAFISAAAGLAGSDRTREPVPAWSAQRLQRLAHRAEAIGADVEDRRRRRAPSADAHLGEIVGVDELVAVGAVAEHEDVGAVGDPFEQDPEDAEPAVTEDGSRPDDGDVEALRRRLEAGPLGGELGVAVRLDGRGHGGRQHRDCWPGTPNTALDDVCTNLPTPASHRLLQQQVGAVDVDGTQQLLVLGQRYLGDVVEDDVARRSPHARTTSRSRMSPMTISTSGGRSSESLRSSTRTRGRLRPAAARAAIRSSRCHR